jgi:hypothetical protein
LEDGAAGRVVPHDAAMDEVDALIDAVENDREA